MSSAWIPLAVLTLLAASSVPYLVRRNQQTARRNEAALARLQSQYETELANIRGLLVGLDRVRLDVLTVLSDGPLTAGRLDELGLARRFDVLQAPLRGQLIGRTGLEALRERVRHIVHNPFPDSGSEQDRQVREAIGRGASQQAAAHAALESLREVASQLQQRESELASRVLTLVGR
jgi:hypothetical protein